LRAYENLLASQYGLYSVDLGVHLRSNVRQILPYNIGNELETAL